MSGALQYYWDTCVFVAYLNDERTAYGDLIDHIRQFLDEARNGDRILHCSTITIAEITRSKMVNSSHNDFRSFLSDFSSAVVPTAPDPNIMALASELRNLGYTKTGGKRKLQTPDAIHLATAITLIETYGVTLEAFHTFDNGKSRSPEGKGVPLLSFQDWCADLKEDPIVKKVISLNRCVPQHPTKKFDF